MRRKHDAVSGAYGCGNSRTPLTKHETIFSQMAEQENSSPGRQLFIDFLEDFLQISFIRFSSDGTVILFRGPHDWELSVPASTMYEPREQARQIIRAKVEASEKEAA